MPPPTGAPVASLTDAEWAQANGYSADGLVRLDTVGDTAAVATSDSTRWSVAPDSRLGVTSFTTRLTRASQPPLDPQAVVALDASLEAHKPHLQYRWQKFLKRRRELEVRESPNSVCLLPPRS
jgi:hypothetical protein